MTMTAVGGIHRFPDVQDLNMSVSQGITTLDVGTDFISEIFRIPQTGTISKVHYRINGVSSPLLTLRIELRTVDETTGFPNAAGTLYGSSTSITVVNPTAGLKTAAVNCTGATAGDLVALVFDISAYTSGSVTLATRVAGAILSSVRIFPYTVLNTTGSTAVAIDQFNNFGLEYGTDTFYAMATSAICGTQQSNTCQTGGGTNKRLGNRLRPPVPMRAVGISASMDLDGDCFLRLRLASDDSILATCTVDANVRGNAAGGIHEVLFDAGATINMTAGTDYYALVETNSATATTVYRIGSLPTNSMLDQLSGGKTCYTTIYVASYADDNLSRSSVGVLFDAVDNGDVLVSETYLLGGA